MYYNMVVETNQSTPPLILNTHNRPQNVLMSGAFSRLDLCNEVDKYLFFKLERGRSFFVPVFVNTRVSPGLVVSSLSLWRVSRG